MLKNIAIAVMAGVLVVEYIPWYAAGSVREKLGVFIGITTILIIFCFFCDEVAERWQQRRKRVREIEDKVRRLRHDRREISKNHDLSGRG